MVNVPVLFRLEAKRGKEADVDSFLSDGLPAIEEEPAITAWFRIHRARGPWYGSLRVLEAVHPPHSGALT
ncbi:MAG: hypothetical protein ACREYE_16060 [Gammaproteobacteria bacterium]